MQEIKLIECPRDAMQGWLPLIPTAQKIEYINTLLQVGFDTIDFGSFVSPKAIPQMADTAAVIEQLDCTNAKSKLLAIIANTRGAEAALQYDAIDYVGFPFSVSPTFQMRNTNSTIQQSLGSVAEIQNLCVKNNKQLVVYISMGFGNPYGDDYNEEIVFNWVEKIVQMDIGVISLADTVGLATDSQVSSILHALIPHYTNVEVGVHLHSTAINWQSKVDAALQAGCYRFDGALKGIGGCPMADDVLVGNMDTELMLPYFKQLGRGAGWDMQALEKASRMATEIFGQQH